MGHFDYLLEGQAQTKTASSDRLELLANIAAKRYLEEGGSLNDSIKKFAGENDLNSNQIERVCEMANIATHRGLWRKTAQKEDIAFPLADAKSVVGAVSPSKTCGCGDEKPACSQGTSVQPISSDYSAPPRGLPDSGPSLMSMMGVDPGKVHNGLGPEPEKKRIIIVLQKKAAERQDCRSKLLVHGMQLETLEKQAFGEVKQTVLGGATFRQIYEAATGAGLRKLAEEYLPGFEEKLISDTHGDVRTRLVKMAIGKAPEDMISSSLGNMTVVNGAHPVLVSLDTINRKTGEIRNGLQNILRIDDEVKFFTQRLRELT